MIDYDDYAADKITETVGDTLIVLPARALSTFGVYLFTSTDGAPVYVGRTATGLHRPCDPAHEVRLRAARAALDWPDFELHFWPLANDEEAVTAEAWAIRELQPRFNRTGKDGTDVGRDRVFSPRSKR